MQGSVCIGLAEDTVFKLVGAQPPFICLHIHVPVIKASIVALEVHPANSKERRSEVSFLSARERHGELFA